MLHKIVTISRCEKEISIIEKPEPQNEQNIKKPTKSWLSHYVAQN